jgi:hypothetical protein
MSYLSQPTSLVDYGVVKIGDFINVNDGVVSLDQDVSPSADVIFNKVEADELLDNGNRVITSVSASADAGISIIAPVTSGPDASFTVKNTGVLSLLAGSGITISQSTGDITISSYGADLINVTGVTSNYTATLADEYIGVSSAGALTITLPLGVEGRVYSIKDEYGQGSGKITIQPQTGQKIDGKTNYVIGVPYQCVSCVFRAGNWWIM